MAWRIHSWQGNSLPPFSHRTLYRTRAQGYTTTPDLFFKRSRRLIFQNVNSLNLKVLVTKTI